MRWDPGSYLRFETLRSRPAMDLLSRIDLQSPRLVADLGCGPGNSTDLLLARWPGSEIIGVDNSPEMLAAARASVPGVIFEDADIASWSPPSPLDVIFSNSTLHWLPGHRTLIPRLASLLSPGGVLAFQVPTNFDAPSHTELRRLASNPPFSALVGDLAERQRNVLSPAEYLEITGGTAQVWETTYFQVLQGEDPVFEWVRGTALRPYLDRLGEDHLFFSEYRAALRAAYPASRGGWVVFPFSRLFVTVTIDGESTSMEPA